MQFYRVDPDEYSYEGGFALAHSTGATLVQASTDEQVRDDTETYIEVIQVRVDLSETVAAQHGSWRRAVWQGATYKVLGFVRQGSWLIFTLGRLDG